MSEPVGHRLVRHDDDCGCGKCIGRPRYGPEAVSAFAEPLAQVRRFIGGFVPGMHMPNPAPFPTIEQTLAALDRIERLAADAEVAAAWEQEHGGCECRTCRAVLSAREEGDGAR